MKITKGQRAVIKEQMEEVLTAGGKALVPALTDFINWHKKLYPNLRPGGRVTAMLWELFNMASKQYGVTRGNMSLYRLLSHLHDGDLMDSHIETCLKSIWREWRDMGTSLKSFERGE